jgi:splicing factor 3A subunit 2
MDFQNRVGSKTGMGGVASAQEMAIQRRERLRKLAQETIDVSKDPYLMKNHLGTFECKLCLTIHSNEGSYLAHTQNRKHQMNLARRALKDSRDGQQAAAKAPQQTEPKKHVVKIGRPGYKVIKIRDPETHATGLLFHIHYPDLAKDAVPRHRFMSA